MKSNIDFEIAVAGAETDKTLLPVLAVAALLLKILPENRIRAIKPVGEQFRPEMPFRPVVKNLRQIVYV